MEVFCPRRDDSDMVELRRLDGIVVYVPATSALDDTFDLLRSVGASELNPRRTDDAWFSKGAILDQLGRHEEAERCYEKAHELEQHIDSSTEERGN